MDRVYNDGASVTLLSAGSVESSSLSLLSASSICGNGLVAGGGQGRSKIASLNFRLSVNFLFVGKCSSINAKFEAEKRPISKKSMGKIKTLSTHHFLCWKFAAVYRKKINFLSRLLLLTHNSAGQRCDWRTAFSNSKEAGKPGDARLCVLQMRLLLRTSAVRPTAEMSETRESLMLAAIVNAHAETWTDSDV